MARLGVGDGESLVNPNNAVLWRGCEALGYDWHTLARNARGCDPEQCGYCVYGCRHGGKQSAAVTYLRDAQALGDTVIITSCRAESVTIANGQTDVCGTWICFASGVSDADGDPILLHYQWFINGQKEEGVRSGDVALSDENVRRFAELYAAYDEAVTTPSGHSGVARTFLNRSM